MLSLILTNSIAMAGAGAARGVKQAAQNGFNNHKIEVIQNFVPRQVGSGDWISQLAAERSRKQWHRLDGQYDFYSSQFSQVIL